MGAALQAIASAPIYRGPMSATPTLETQRIILRPVELTDAPEIQRLLPHANVVRYLAAVPWPYPDDGAEQYLTQVLLPAVEAGTQLSWAITLKAAGTGLIGAIDYLHEATHTGNRGFWLAEEYWGRGLMTEALAAVEHYVFSELGVSSMIVTNAQANLASSRLKRSSGARLIEVRDDEYVTGTYPTEVWEIKATQK